MSDYYGRNGRRASYDDYDDYGSYDEYGSSSGYGGSRRSDGYGRPDGYGDSDGYGYGGTGRQARRSSYDDSPSYRSQDNRRYDSYSSGQRTTRRTQYYDDKYYDDRSYGDSGRSQSAGRYARETQRGSQRGSYSPSSRQQSRSSTRGGYSSRGQSTGYSEPRSRQGGGSRGYSSRNQQVYAGPYGIDGGSQGAGGLGGLLDRFGLTVPKLIIGIVAIIILIVLLVSLVRCVAGAVSGTQESSSSAAVAVSTNSGDSASSGSAASTTASTEGVEDPWVESGRFSTGDPELDQMVKKFCDDNSNPELSAADNAFNVYCAVVWGEYIESDDNQEPLGPNWDIEYAKQYITAGGGNCYNFCAFNEYVLKYFGYSDATAEPCIVLRQSGDYGDHGLVFVTNIEDGRRCLCDSAYGANGWMVDIDSYTMQVRNIGQDPSEFTVAPFEDISVAPWYDGA